MRHYPSPKDARGCGNTRTRETQIPWHGPRRGADSGGSRADAGYRPEQLPQEADQDHRPAILSVSLLDSFAIRNLVADVVISLAFGLLGYVMLKGGFTPIPLLLGLVLGEMVERNYHRALSSPPPSFPRL